MSCRILLSIFSTSKEHLLRLYALGILDAKAFCIACYWASKSGSHGDGIRRFGLPPDQSTGNYSKHLSRHLPKQESAPELTMVEIPVMLNGKRQTKLIPVAPIHEVMEAEIKVCDDLVAASDETDWSQNFRDHPHRVKPDDPRDVHPISIYMDGIKYNRAIGPRADTLVGVTAYNVRTNRRHLIAVLSKYESCGWDSLWPILNHMRWSLAAAAEGRRPMVRWDGSIWPEGSVYSTLSGSELSARFLLVQIKADWMEFCSSLGFPSWSSVNAPCFLCGARKSQLFDFRGVDLESDPWGPKGNSYDNECSKSEIEVIVKSEADRQAILVTGGLHTRKKPAGRVLANDVPMFRLKGGDRLEPNADLPNSAMFEDKMLPFTAVFWRSRTDGLGRISSWVLRRCPLFCDEVGVTPNSVLHIDTLHTLYSGVMAVYVYTVIQECLDQNLYNIGGAQDIMQEQTLERLVNDYTYGFRQHRTTIFSRMRTKRTGARCLVGRAGRSNKFLTRNIHPIELGAGGQSLVSPESNRQKLPSAHYHSEYACAGWQARAQNKSGRDRRASSMGDRLLLARSDWPYARPRGETCSRRKVPGRVRAAASRLPICFEMGNV